MEELEKKRMAIEELKEKYLSDIRQIKDLTKQGMIEEVLELCKQDQFKNDSVVQEIRVNLLIQKGRFDEAREICNQPRFLTDFLFQKYRSVILKNKPAETNLPLTEQQSTRTSDKKIQKRDTISMDFISIRNKSVVAHDKVAQQNAFYYQLVSGTAVRKELPQELPKQLVYTHRTDSQVVKSTIIAYVE